MIWPGAPGLGVIGMQRKREKEVANRRSEQRRRTLAALRMPPDMFGRRDPFGRVLDAPARKRCLL